LNRISVRNATDIEEVDFSEFL